MIRRTLACALILTLSWTGWVWAAGPAHAQGTSEHLSHDEALARLDRLMNLIGEMRSHIDRSQFDLDALLDKLDYDADNIIKFVKEEIYFEQYPGLLRGAQGTLMSRAGNALDQAVLLATLLRDAGLEARLQRGQLDEDLSFALCKGILLKRSADPPLGNLEAISENLSRMLHEFAGAPPAEAESIVAAALGEQPVSEKSIQPAAIHEAERLIRRLREQGLLQDKDQKLKEVLSEAKDYYWVQWRSEPSKPWVDIHAAFGSDSPNITIPPEETYTDSVPANRQYRFRTEVSLERRLGGKTTEVVLARDANRPTANLVGEPVTVSLVPDTIRRIEDLQRLEERLEQAQIWIPMIDRVPGQLAFDFLGNVVDTLAAGAPGAGLFQTVGSDFSRAAGILSGDGDEQTVSAISRLWVDFVVTGPDGTEDRYRTDILSESLMTPEFDSGQQANASLMKKGLLSSVHTAMLAVGEYPEGYILDRSLDRLQALSRFTQSHLSRATKSEADGSWADELGSLETSFIGHLDFFSSVDLGLKAQQTHSYRSGPSIVVFSQLLSPPGRVTTLLNVISNPRRSLVDDDGSLAFAPERTVQAGVWESFVESALLASGSGQHFSASSALGHASEFGEEFKILLPGSEGHTEDLVTSTTTASWIREDLKKGYAVIAPTSQLTSTESRSVWWRVDPSSGETLAMMSGGYGISLTQDLIFKIAISAALVACTAAFWGCMGGLPDNDGNVGDPSRKKVFSCAVCGLFALATTYLAVTTVLTSGPAVFAAWRGGQGVTVFVPRVPAAELKKLAMEIASIVMGVFCGVASVAE